MPSSTSVVCVFCREHPEPTPHLFFSYRVIYNIWLSCNNWIGNQGALPREGMAHFHQHVLMCKSKKVNGMWKTIWFAKIWIVWLSINAFIFNAKAIDVEEICRLIKWRAWLWLRARVTTFKASYYEWEIDPGYCLSMGAAADR